MSKYLDATPIRDRRHGNVAFLVDNDGVVLEKYTYDVFGQPTIIDMTFGQTLSSTSYIHDFLFQGREYIHQLGIYDYRNRFYFPATGRFLQSDPKGFDAGDMNLFRYCGDDPVDLSDPLGLEGEHFDTLEPAIRWARSLVMKEVLNPNRKPITVPLPRAGGSGAQRSLTYFPGVSVPVVPVKSGGYDIGRTTFGKAAFDGTNYYDAEPQPSARAVPVHSHSVPGTAKPGIGRPGWSIPDKQFNMVERMDENNPGVWHRRTSQKDGRHKEDTFRDNGSNLKSPSNRQGGDSSSGSQSSGPSARDVDLNNQGTGVPSLGQESVNMASGPR